MAEWVLPSVPVRGGGGKPNPLDPLNRWKIVDNLRRSLLSPISLALLLLGWLALAGGAWLATVLVGLLLFFPAILRTATQLVTQPRPMATSRQGWEAVGPAWARALLDCAFLPHQALLALDAIARVW